MTPETSARPDLAAKDRARPVVEHVGPVVDCGRYPAKRIAGDTILVHTDVFADGHDLVTAEVRWRGPAGGTWASAPMRPAGNDRWEGSFKVADPGRYEFAVRAGMDRFATWVHGLTAKVDAGQDVRGGPARGGAAVDDGIAAGEGTGGRRAASCRGTTPGAVDFGTTHVVLRAGLAPLPGPARCAAPLHRLGRGRCARPRRLAASSCLPPPGRRALGLLGDAPRRRRQITGRLRELVRALPALGVAGPRTPGSARRCRRPASRRRPHGL